MDFDEREHDADEVDADAEGQYRRAGNRRPQEDDEAGYDERKARDHKPDAPDRQPAVGAETKILQMGRFGVALARGADALDPLLGSRRPGVHGVV